MQFREEPDDGGPRGVGEADYRRRGRPPASRKKWLNLSWRDGAGVVEHRVSTARRDRTSRRPGSLRPGLACTRHSWLSLHLRVALDIGESVDPTGFAAFGRSAEGVLEDVPDTVSAVRATRMGIGALGGVAQASDRRVGGVRRGDDEDAVGAREVRPSRRGADGARWRRAGVMPWRRGLSMETLKTKATVQVVDGCSSNF
jgi:hypothetical protein